MSVTKISITKAHQHLGKKGLVVDVRDPVSFRDYHIRDAINVSVRNIQTLLVHGTTKPIILYGSSDDDPNIKIIANYLSQLGFLNVYSIGSVENWKDC